jgi:hypothetical protein
MPRRKLRTARTSPNRDIEAIREVIVSGVPWLAPDQHHDLTRGLTMEQKALLGHLTPFCSAAKFICDLDPEVLALAKRELKEDIAAAEAGSMRYQSRKSEP